MIFFSTFVLQYEGVTDGLRDIARDEQALQPGNYYIIVEGRSLSCAHSQAVVEL